MRMIAMKEAPNKRDETDSSFCHVEAAVIDVEREESFPPAGTGQRPEKATFFLFVVTRFRGARLNNRAGSTLNRPQGFGHLQEQIMIKCKRSPALNSGELLSILLERWRTHDRGWGLCALVGTFIFLSTLAGLFQGGRPGLYLAGEIASQDVVADRDLLVEDDRATQLRREQLAAVQPRIFDVDKASLLRFREEALTLLRTADQASALGTAAGEAPAPAGAEAEGSVEQDERAACSEEHEDNNADDSAAAQGAPEIPLLAGREPKSGSTAGTAPWEGAENSAEHFTTVQSRSPFSASADTISGQGAGIGGKPETVSALLHGFNARYGLRVTEPDFRELFDPNIRLAVLKDVLPWMESRLSEGILPDIRQVVARNAIIVRDPENGRETLRKQADGLHDVRSLDVELGLYLRSLPGVDEEGRRALTRMLPRLLIPTLTINPEASRQRDAIIQRAVKPVLHRVQRGEVVVRSGDAVSYEQQLKMQALAGPGPGFVDWIFAPGVLVLSCLLGLGLFLLPASSREDTLKTQDELFIALLLLVFGGAAWVISSVLQSVPGPNSALMLVYAYPVAGGAGLAALIFSSRHYCVISLLLAFFCTVMFHGDVGLFCFYFLSAVANTRLVIHAQSRHDTVWAGLPLFIWLLVSGIGAAFFARIDFTHVPILVLALAFNALLSVLLLFALSPILETVLGYTTRFRLMELMNLEQPLLQELMMNVPGTYHHSLIVSNLVEAGASSVGANSLLCKVGALYHDIGKLQRPDYFVENQFGGPNPHDKLSPAMSALVLCSHVKRGVELGEEFKLGDRICQIIAQHHGNRTIQYFFNKAKELGENPRPEDYRYPNQRPQSREAAIVMMADSVEAASRTLMEPTPARIRSLVENIIKSIYAERQLDETELTFRDLSKIIESFSRILTGLFHQRIAYPKNDVLAKGEDVSAVSGKAMPAPAADEPAAPSDIPGKDISEQSGDA